MSFDARRHGRPHTHNADRSAGPQDTPGKRTLTDQIQRDEQRGAPGAGIDQQAAIADLQRITEKADQVRAALQLDVRMPAEQRADLMKQLEDLARELEALSIAYGDLIRTALKSPFTRAHDAIVHARQIFALYYADQTLQAWSDASPEKREAQRAAYRKESGGLQPTDEWCGAFINAQYRSAGMNGGLSRVFNSAFAAREFFMYGDGSANSPQTIVPHGKGEAKPLKAYHTERGALRDWLDHGHIDEEDIRSGDVVTLDWLTRLDDENDAKESDPEWRADHVCIVRSYEDGILITIDGNAYGAKRSRGQSPQFDEKGEKSVDAAAPSSDVSTSRYEPGTGGSGGRKRMDHNDGPAFNRDKMFPSAYDTKKGMTIMGRGRPSVVDFEADHVYSHHPPADGPGGPIQEQVQRLESGAPVSADPGAAFDAATQGTAGAIPYRAELQQHLGADFSSVRAFFGRDLSALGASAATRGETIAFASPTPDKATVAHELTHVLQSRQGRTGATALSDPSDASEHEARSVASSLPSDRPAPITAAPSAAIHRDTPPAVMPAVNQNDNGAGLDWDIPYGMDQSKPKDGPGPWITVRELFDHYFLLHLQEMFSEPCKDYGKIPSDLIRATSEERRAAVVGVYNYILSNQTEDSGTTRVKLFKAKEHAVIDALRVGTSFRYAVEGEKTFCQVYAHDVVTAMGAYLPRVWWTEEGKRRLDQGHRDVIPKPVFDRLDNTDGKIHNEPTFTQQLNANSVYDWLETWGESFGWERIKNPRTAQERANEGYVVVISATAEIPKTEKTPGSENGLLDDGMARDKYPDGMSSGHITVVLAETSQRKPPVVEKFPDLPLQSQAGIANFATNAEGVKGNGAGTDGRTAWWERKEYTGAGMWAYTGAGANAMPTPDPEPKPKS